MKSIIASVTPLPLNLIDRPVVLRIKVSFNVPFLANIIAITESSAKAH
jgi:hypothetical protein